MDSPDSPARAAAGGPPAAAPEVRLGEAVRALRQARRLSVRALAAATGFSPSFISQVEHGLASPSVASSGRIAAALGATLGEFFDRAAAAPAPGPGGAPAVVRGAARRRLVSSWSRALIEGLGRADAAPALEPLLITFLPGGRSGSGLHAVAGEQFAHVLAGELRLAWAAATAVLRAGDSVVVPPRAGHRWENAGGEVARVLLVTQRAAGGALPRATPGPPPPGDARPPGPGGPGPVTGRR